MNYRRPPSIARARLFETSLDERGRRRFDLSQSAAGAKKSRAPDRLEQTQPVLAEHFADGRCCHVGVLV
jgi:hypothetical protein